MNGALSQCVREDSRLPPGAEPHGGTRSLGRISPLELLHPDGSVHSATVIGSSCPPRLRPETGTPAGGQADLIILAPARHECRRPGWLEQAARRLEERLARDGLVYVLAPAPWRWKICRLLGDQRFTLEPFFLHMPDQASSRFLVPLQLGPAQHALTNLIPTRPWKRRLALSALGLRGAPGLLGTWLPSVGFAARRTRGRWLFEWLEQRHPGPKGGTPIVSATWRGPRGSVVVLAGSGRLYPSAVAKLRWSEDESPVQRDELAALAHLGPSARHAGAQVPEPLYARELGGHRAVFQSALPGQSAAALLMSQPTRLYEIMELLVGWLETWNRTTRLDRAGTRAHLERELVEPAARLAPLIVEGPAYRAWLTQRCASLESSVPRVAAHNDLTMWNVLLHGKLGLGIVDWEEASEESLPLVDFVYAVTDAAMLAGSTTDRLMAFESCFAPWGAHHSMADRLMLRLRSTLGVSAELVDLCLHACFLRHALNEQHRSDPDDPLPFLRIARWLASNRDLVKRWVAA